MENLIGKYRIYPFNYYLEKQKKCLSVSANSPKPWSSICVTDYDANNQSQELTFERIGDQFKILTCYNKQVFDVEGYRMENGTSVIQYPDNGGANQHWNITKVDKQMLSMIMSTLKIDINELPDTIYSIDVLGFSLTTSNNQAIISNEANDLYVLEKVL